MGLKEIGQGLGRGLASISPEQRAMLLRTAAGLSNNPAMRAGLASQAQEIVANQEAQKEAQRKAQIEAYKQQEAMAREKYKQDQANARAAESNKPNSVRVAEAMGLERGSTEWNDFLRKSELKSLVTSSTQITMPGEKKGWEAIEQNAGEQLGVFQNAQFEAQNILSLTDTFDKMQDGAYQGKLAPLTNELVGWAKALGVGDTVLDSLNLEDKQGKTELLRSTINQMTLARRTSQRDPQLNAQENALLQRAGAMLDGSPEGNRAVVALLRRHGKWQEQLAKVSREAISGARNTKSTPWDAYNRVSAWLDHNPLFDEETANQLDRIMSEKASQTRPPGVPEGFVYKEVDGIKQWVPAQ